MPIFTYKVHKKGYGEFHVSLPVVCPVNHYVFTEPETEILVHIQNKKITFFFLAMVRGIEQSHTDALPLTWNAYGQEK